MTFASHIDHAARYHAVTFKAKPGERHGVLARQSRQRVEPAHQSEFNIIRYDA